MLKLNFLVRLRRHEHQTVLEESPSSFVGCLVISIILRSIQLSMFDCPQISALLWSLPWLIRPLDGAVGENTFV